MSAQKFLDLVEQSGLLSGSLLAELRKQVSDQNASAAAVAKHLVEKGELTRFQATRLVSEATDTPSGKDNNPQPAEPEDDELALAPLDDDEDEDSWVRGLLPPPANDVIMLEDAGDALKPVEDAGGGLTPVGAPVGLSPLGPTEGPVDELLPDLDAFDALEDFSESASTRGPRRPIRRVNVWESKLMLGGGLALALLLILFAVLFINISKTPAIERWDAAMESYRVESYSQAQAGFEKLLEDYPEDEHASEARVRIVLCKIRNVIREPREALARSEQLLPTIETEAAFSVARDELATILLQVPQSFVGAAKNASERPAKEDLVALAAAGLALVNNPSYVPSSRRNLIQAELTRVVEDVNLVQRDIDRDHELNAAIDEIDIAAEAERTAQAYDIYRQLVRRYPGLESNPALIASIKRVAAREQRLVLKESDVLVATTSADDFAAGRLVLARGGLSANLTSRTLAAVVIRVEQSVYGIDASNGHVLWRRNLGDTSWATPLPVAPDPAADVLVVDTHRHALLRIARESGELKWSLVIGETFSQPVVVDGRIYATTMSGRIFDIDLESGRSEQQMQLPQPTTTGPAPTPTRPLLFQVGQHSNLYTVATDTFTCANVFYLGHKAGTVVVPAIVQGGHLFVVENAGVDYALLHILAIGTDENGETNLSPAQTAVRLRGNVVVPMQMYARRLLIVTDHGAVEVFDVDVNQRPPASIAASLPPTLDDPLVLFPATDAGTLWVAGDRLTQYRVQVTTKQITRRAISHAGDIFIDHPRVAGGNLLAVRKPKQGAGVVINASSLDDSRKEIWRTQIGVPVAHVDKSLEKVIQVVTSAGSLFELESAELSQPISQLVNDSSRSTASFSQTVLLDGGGVACFDTNYQEMLVLHSESKRLRRVKVELPPAQVTALPAPFAEGLLFPLSNGEVHLLSVETGKQVCKPFRPRLTPGERVKWLRPAALNENEFVIADDRRVLYRVALRTEPTPHLSLVHSQPTELDFVSPLAVEGSSVFAIARSQSSDVLVAADTETLQISDQFDLQGTRVTWGPRKIADAVLFVTDHAELHCFTAAAHAVWDQPAAFDGQPADWPLIQEDAFVFATRSGSVLSISRSTGETLGRIDVGERVHSGPLAVDGRLLVGGENGVLHLIPIPPR